MKKLLFILLTICLFSFGLCFFVNAAGENAQSAVPIKEGEIIDITLTEDACSYYFKFIPENKSSYELSVYGAVLEDVYITIYDSTGDYVESGSWNQFTNECFVACDLKASETYYLYVCYMDLDNINLSVSVKEHNHTLKKEYYYKATTEDDGEYELSCTRCDYYDYCYIPYIETVKLSSTSFIFDETAKTPTLIINDSDGKELKEGTDFTLSGEVSAQEIGSHSIKITFTGDYVGSKTLTYKINPPLVESLAVKSQTSDSITLSWDKLENVESYIVYAYKDSTKKYTKVTTVNTNTVTIDNLKSGTTYSYAVRAFNASCYGKYSSIITTTTNPAAPTLKATQTTESITLTWNKITGAAGYVIYSYNDKDKQYTKVSTVKNNKTTIKDLDSATAYHYAIRAYKKLNSKNYYSSYSSILKTATKPTKPTNLKASQTTTSITLTWKKVSGATSYTVYDYFSDEKITTVKTNKATIKKLYDSTNYEYYVIANAKIDGKTYSSSKVVIKTATKPLTVSYLSVKSGSKKATLNWYAEYCNGYVIYMATSKNGEYKKIKTISNSDWEYSYTVKNLTKGKTYYFKMKTYIKTGSGNVYSAWSAIKSVKIK